MKFQFDGEEGALSSESIDALNSVAAAAEERFALPECSVDLLFPSAEEMRDLNAQTRGIGSVTDVLSYPSLEFEEPGRLPELHDYDYDPETGALLLGSIAMCPERIREQAAEYGHSFRRELGYLFCHGLCHLMGYDHLEETDRRLMREQEEALMERAGIPREG